MSLPAKGFIVEGRGLALYGGAVVLALAILWITVANVLDMTAAIVLLPAAVMLLIALSSGTRLWSGRGRRFPRLLTASEVGLFADDRLVAPRATLRAGFVLPQPEGRALVRLLRRHHAPLRLEVGTIAEGRALLESLGLDASHAVATFVLGNATIHVGADGVLVVSFGRSRFIEYREILDVSAWKRGAVLTLASGERLRLPSRVTPDAYEPTDAVAERIREAMEAHRSKPGDAETMFLRPGTRTASDWLRSLRALGSGAALDHRTAPMPPERLWRIVEDASAEPTARVGAAVVLTTSATTDDRRRLRAIAEASASPKVRVAIEAAARDAEDEALAEVLSQLEESSERSA